MDNTMPLTIHFIVQSTQLNVGRRIRGVVGVSTKKSVSRAHLSSHCGFLSNTTKVLHAKATSSDTRFPARAQDEPEAKQAEASASGARSQRYYRRKGVRWDIIGIKVTMRVAQSKDQRETMV